MTPAIRSLLTALFASTALVGCAAVPTDIDAPDTEGTESDEARRGDASQFYLLRPDFRRCVSPLCGGVWVRRVNQPTTRCADGRWADECYVAELDVRALGLSEEEASEFSNAARSGHALVRGRIQARTYGTFGNLGELVAQEGYRAATDAEPSGPFYRVRDNGIRCITYPCFSLSQDRLNSTRTSTLSGLDLSRVPDATEAQIEAANAALATTDGVLVAGTTRTVRNAGPAGDGRVLRGTQFYLRVGASVADAQFCNDSSECTMTQFHSAPTSVDECYCPSCPTTAMNISTADRNQTAVQRICRAANAGCPVFRCAAPPAPACVNHACSFGLDSAGR